MGVEFDAMESNFFPQKERCDESSLQISEEPSCGRKHELELRESRGRDQEYEAEASQVWVPAEFKKNGTKGKSGSTKNRAA